MSIKVLVADHQEVMRAGLKALVERSDIEISAEASTEKELFKLAKDGPDVIVLDVRFAGEDGFSTLARLKKKFYHIPVLMWSTGNNPTYIARAMALEATGFLPREVSRREMLASIRTAASGTTVWSREQQSQFVGPAEVPAAVAVRLTPREKEVMRQLAYGLPNKEIGAALGISYETVKEHIQHILRKLGVTDRTEAAVWAVRNGIA